MKSVVWFSLFLCCLAGCTTTNNPPYTFESWDSPPKKDELYMLMIGEFAFEKDFLVTCLLQRWGENNYIPPTQNGWIKLKKRSLPYLLNMGWRVIYLPNGKEDLPYLNLRNEDLRSFPCE